MYNRIFIFTISIFVISCCPIIKTERGSISASIGSNNTEMLLRAYPLISGKRDITGMVKFHAVVQKKF